MRLGHDGDDGDARGRADGLGSEARKQGRAGLFGDSCDDVYELGGLGEGIAGRGLSFLRLKERKGVEVEVFEFFSLAVNDSTETK